MCIVTVLIFQIFEKALLSFIFPFLTLIHNFVNISAAATTEPAFILTAQTQTKYNTKQKQKQQQKT